MGKKKSESGTILKVPSGDFTKEELEFLWDQHNEALKTFEEPKERYTRFLSDLIKRVRDISLRLIQAGAIEGLIEKDTAHYVKTKLKERGVPLSNHFYEYFKPEEKREWQSDDQEEVKPSDHKHEFQSLGKINGMGEVSRCGAPCIPACSAMIIDGRLFEQQELEEKDPEPKKQKEKTKFEEKNDFIIAAFENAADKLKAVANVWKFTDAQLTDDETKLIRKDIFLMEKAGDTVDMAYDRKNVIHPSIMHLLAAAYTEATQNVASGVFIMSKIDLLTRKHGQGVKTFTEVGEFAKLLTSKQTSKAMKGKVKELHERYEPQTEEEAMDQGFSGQQCTNCKNFRVGFDNVQSPNYNEGKKDWKQGDPIKDKPDPIHMKYDTELVCYHCFAIQKRKVINLPKQTPGVVMDWQETT